ncbi:MAG: DinB family protein [bacterium]
MRGAGEGDAELSAWVERLAGLRGRAERLFAGMAADAWNRASSAGGWSVAECAAHIVETNEKYLEPLRAEIARGRAAGVTGAPPFRYRWFGRWFVAQIEPPVRRKLPAPEAFRPARRTYDPSIGREVLRTLDELANVMRSSAGLDRRRLRITSPAARFLRFDLGIGILLLIAHTDRHLGQIENLTFDTQPSRPRRGS